MNDFQVSHNENPGAWIQDHMPITPLPIAHILIECQRVVKAFCGIGAITLRSIWRVQVTIPWNKVDGWRKSMMDLLQGSPSADTFPCFLDDRPRNSKAKSL